MNCDHPTMSIISTLWSEDDDSGDGKPHVWPAELFCGDCFLVDPLPVSWVALTQVFL